MIGYTPITNNGINAIFLALVNEDITSLKLNFRDTQCDAEVM